MAINNDAVAAKRTIAAKQSIDHLARLGGRNLGNLLDMSAGGAVLQQIERRGIASKMDAVEISASGIERVISRHLASSTPSGRSTATNCRSKTTQ
jgi:hypothetical protein